MGPDGPAAKESDMNLSHTNTRIDEIADGLYRISTDVPELMPGGFSFNQFLIVDDAPLLFHTGPRSLFDSVSRAIARVLDPACLRYIAFSHLEADECGAINPFLERAPAAQAVCSQLGAGVFLADSALRPARGLAHGEQLELGRHVLTWLDAPHLPHGMDCGYMFERHTRTLLCGDLFTQPGSALPPVTEGDIFAPSEAMRAGFPYAPIQNARDLLGRLAAAEPKLLACMHGSSFRGDGAPLLRALGEALSPAA
jgi:flavorubredoxin